MNETHVLYLLTCVLVFIIFVLVWYIKQLIIRLNNFLDDTYELRDMASQYSKHLKQVYELETFYGDPTLQNLMNHAKHVESQIKQFQLFNELPGRAEEGYDDYQEEEEAE